MNNPHHGARLTLHSREQIGARVGAGQSAAEVAAAFAVSVRTVRKWLARFRAGGHAALANGASAPARVARRLTDTALALIAWLRRELRLTGVNARGISEPRPRSPQQDRSRHPWETARASEWQEDRCCPTAGSTEGPRSRQD